MLTITLRDLQWRARRFGLGVAATALVFTTTLLLAGVHASFQEETTRTVRAVGADTWIVPQGASGPFTSSSPVDEQQRARVAATPGVRAAEPIVVFRHVADARGEDHVINVIAHESGGIVRPRLVEGRAHRGRGEVVADERTDFVVGEAISVGGKRLRVVGLTTGLTYFGGTPTLLMTLGDGRELAYGGAPLASAVITRGIPQGNLAGLEVLGFSQVRADLRRPMSGATTTIAVLALILSAVAAGIIGLMTYLSGLDRLMDFAIFKAIGVRTGKLLGGLVLQVLLLALGSALIAAGGAWMLAPAFPIGVHLSATAYGSLAGLALLVGLLVSVVSIRQATAVDPALAFGRT